MFASFCSSVQPTFGEPRKKFYFLVRGYYKINFIDQIRPYPVKINVGDDRKMKTTASGNFSNKQSWSGLKKHMEHDPKIRHSNRFLNGTESQVLRKYNRHKVLIDYSKWTERKFGSFVKEHDEKMKDKKRRFGSVDRFLKVDGSGKKRTLQPALTYVEKLSNEDNWKVFRSALEKKLQSYKWTSGPKKGQNLTPSEAKEITLNTISKGFEGYANGFNKRNPNLHMFEYYVHMDEEGAPHLHGQIMPFTEMGQTKKGNLKKPSWSLNTALAKQYNSPRKNKENLSRFRKQEDQALIDSMNRTLEKKLGIKQAFQLVRKTDSDKTLQTGVDHDVYKARAKAIEQQEKQKQINNKEIITQTKALTKLKSEQKGIETKQEKITTNLKLVANQLTSKQKNLTIRENKLNSRETRLNARETALNARERNLTAFEQNTQRALLQRETALKKREENQKKKEEEQKKKERDLIKRETELKKQVQQAYVYQETGKKYYKKANRLVAGLNEGLKAGFKTYFRYMDFTEDDAEVLVTMADRAKTAHEIFALASLPSRVKALYHGLKSGFDKFKEVTGHKLEDLPEMTLQQPEQEKKPLKPLQDKERDDFTGPDL